MGTIIKVEQTDTVTGIDYRVDFYTESKINDDLIGTIATASSDEEEDSSVKIIGIEYFAVDPLPEIELKDSHQNWIHNCKVVDVVPITKQ